MTDAPKLEEHICASVRNRPIGSDTLRKYFRKEIEIGAAELNAQVGNFMIATPFTDPVRPLAAVQRPWASRKIAFDRVRSGVQKTRIAVVWNRSRRMRQR